MGRVILHLPQAGGAEGLDVGDPPRTPIYPGEQGELIPHLLREAGGVRLDW